MPKYKVMLTETLQRDVEIDADDISDAISIAQEMYDNSEIILDETDYKGVEINEAPIELKKDNIAIDLNYENGFAKNEFLQYMYSEFPSVYHNSHSRELLENVINYCTSNTFDVKNKLVPTLEILIPEIKKNEIIRFVDAKTINTKDYSYEYQLLDRLRSDCDYFLGNGHRNPDNLWAKNVTEQIEKMRELYKILPLEPEWLSMSAISNYEKLMTNTNVITKITSLEDLKEAIQDLDWSVSECSFGNNEVGWDISKYSPAGEDFSFSICHNNDVKTALKEIYDYAYNFDKAEHAETYIVARVSEHRKDIPSSSVLLEDGEAIQKMLDELSEYCNSFDIELEEDKDEIENDEDEISM
ncbi:LPD11 domain-containing protein [uncultured Clostridium sp.]|uniref:LPD11 domain-containing protein n=1 Tax=uncultured Clostridium sp. TaxID=59620 RepID=UPI00272A0BB3|nr:LPD11 domain-containing protein [uncultured Clostridium sp.]